jgi:hypothetical protein
MPSFRDYVFFVLSVVEAGVEDVLPKYFPPTTKHCYDDDDDDDDKWDDVDDNFSAETSDDEWVPVPHADVELLPMKATCS